MSMKRGSNKFEKDVFVDNLGDYIRISFKDDVAIPFSIVYK